MRVETAGHARQLLLAAAFSVAAAASALAQGSISGRITSKDTDQPLGDARVMVLGSSIAVHTNAEGRFRIQSVAAGSVTLRVNRLGFMEAKQVVTVTNGAEATANFSLTTAVQQLPDVVTTATGLERRVEVGNSIGVVEAAERVKEMPIHSIGELLTARAPGVMVLNGNMSGGAQTIRIRGLNSLSRSNAPIFVVDGIRIDGGTGGMGTGGTNSSRLNDLSPEEIENIELVKGPSATTLYGTDAANGVVLITTKKGKSGRAKWSWSSEAGTIQDNNEYPQTYALWGRKPGRAAGDTAFRCTLVTVASAACQLDSATTANQLRADGVSPIGTGNRNLHTLQIQGGSDLVRYFASGTIESETGPISMPSLDRLYLASQKTEIRPEWANPERLDRASFRTNVNAIVSPTFDLSVQSMFLRSEQRLPQVDNNVNSFYYNALTNPGFRPADGACLNAAFCMGYGAVSNLGQPLNGWAQFTPAHIFQRTVQEGVKRFVGGTTASWRPFTWLQNDATVGVDFASQRNFTLCRLNECPNFGTQRQGAVNDNHNNGRIFTATVRSTGTYRYSDWGIFRTTVGGDYLNNMADGSNSGSTVLPPGAQTVGAGATPNSSNTLPTATKTLGYYLQEQFAFRDRVFVTGAIRTDQNTAFGTKFQGVWYPKLQASWVISDESFFPRLDLVNSLRLRSAYGSSGVQPGATSSLRTLGATTVSLFTDQAALQASAIGNPNLKPELTTEFEAGFDLDAWSNRIRFEGTFYNKLTSDALVNQSIAASSGAAVTSVLRNLGEVRNTGIEGSVTVQVLDMPEIGWDVTLAGSQNNNKVVSLGLDDAGKPIPTIGTTTRVMAGYPLNSFFVIGYQYADANGDGIIAPTEVTLDPLTDTTYVGQAFAPRQATIATGVDILKRKVRINASFDHRGGHKLFNNTLGFLCAQTTTCFARSSLDAPLWEQARAVAAVAITPVRTNFGYYEKGDFWRFRELSVTADVPQKYTQKYLRVESMNVSLGARNLKVWSDFTGDDPEANYGTGDVPSILLTTAPRQYYTARINIQF
jgi:TonB-linked SusC/RagA family outer membrane protein